LKDNHNSPLPTRSAEYPGRLHVQTPHRPLGLDAQPIPISGPESAVGPIRCRPVRNQVNETTANLLQLETRSRVSRGGCIGPGLESAEWVRTPSMVSDRSDTPEGDSPRGYSDPDCTSLAEPTVVSNSVVSASGPPPTPSTGPSDPLALTELQVANGRELPSTGRMEGLRQQLSARGVLTDAADLILHSWRTKTNSNYNSAWQKWAQWCGDRAHNPFSAPIASFLGFLAHQFALGRGLDAPEGDSPRGNSDPVCPSQLWYPTLLSLLVDHPRLLPQGPQTLWPSQNCRLPMGGNCPQLAAWKVSGNSCQQEEY